MYFERIDSVPLQSDSFSQDFESWLSVTVDSLNETLKNLQSFTEASPVAKHYTSVEIINLLPVVPNGYFFYDTDTNELKAKVNDAIVVIA